MGSWSVYCGISKITIGYGDDVVLIPLMKNKMCEPNQRYHDRYISYHAYGDYEYTFYKDENENTMDEEHLIKIPEFLPNMEKGLYIQSSHQEKDQIYFYFIPHYYKSYLPGENENIIDKLYKINTNKSDEYYQGLKDMYDYCIKNGDELTSTNKIINICEGSYVNIP